MILFSKESLALLYLSVFLIGREVLHFFPSDELVGDDHGSVIWSKVVFELDEEEEDDAEECEKRNKASSTGSF